MSNYNNTPRPLIETHYHIEEIIKSQEKRTEERNYSRNQAKEKEERNDLIKDSKAITLTDFWCDKCKKDFKGMAIREVETDWSCSNQMIAFYRTKCSKGHWCIRLITDRHKDGFYVKSKFVALDRGNHHNDILQPWETGYNLLYAHKNK